MIGCEWGGWPRTRECSLADVNSEWGDWSVWPCDRPRCWPHLLRYACSVLGLADKASPGRTHTANISVHSLTFFPFSTPLFWWKDKDLVNSDPVLRVMGPLPQLTSHHCYHPTRSSFPFTSHQKQRGCRNVGVLSTLDKFSDILLRGGGGGRGGSHVLF